MTFEPRMANPAQILPGAFQGIGGLFNRINVSVRERAGQPSWKQSA